MGGKRIETLKKQHSKPHLTPHLHLLPNIYAHPSSTSCTFIYKCNQQVSNINQYATMAELALPETFLGEEATTEQRWRALHHNVQAYYQRIAQTEESSKVGSLGDIVWTSKRLATASESSLQDVHVIDEILSWYRSQSPLQGAVWWYLHAKAPLKLEAHLLARGFFPDGNPLWMWCNLRALPKSPPADSKFTIRLATDEDYLVSDDESDVITQALCEVIPRRVFHVVACRGIDRLGRCILNVTTGELGTAHLFDMRVVPEERRQGVGAALVQAACELARKMGCNQMTLNATEMGERLYRRFGFQSMGRGRTWFLKPSVLAEAPPSTQQMNFLEAVGLGEIKALIAMRESLTRDQLQDATSNGLTPFEIAVRCQQPGSASWLFDQGVIPHVISAWDLGWKDRVPTLLTKHPDLVKQESGRRMATPLHIAIERNDLELAKVLLAVPNDLDAKDAEFRETPLGWAHRFQRKEMFSLLEPYTDINDPSSDRAAFESILGNEQIRSDLISMKTEA
jgi:GNAT superfamily N-acetyltransferase